MEIVRLCCRLSPYLYRNHLFIHHAGNDLPEAKLGPEYRIEFPCDPRLFPDDAFSAVAIEKNLLLARLGAGDLLGVVIAGNLIVHRTLVQSRGMARMEGDARAFMLNNNDHYIHSCMTIADHRGKGLYAAMIGHVAHSMAATFPSGATYIACRRENRASVCGIRRAGFAYLKSSLVCGALDGRARFRRWYLDPALALPDPRQLAGVVAVKSALDR